MCRARQTLRGLELYKIEWMDDRSIDWLIGGLQNHDWKADQFEVLIHRDALCIVGLLTLCNCFVGSTHFCQCTSTLEALEAPPCGRPVLKLHCSAVGPLQQTHEQNAKELKVYEILEFSAKITCKKQIGGPHTGSSRQGASAFFSLLILQCR